MNAERTESKWVNGIGHLAIVVDDLSKAKWFFGEVLGATVEAWGDTQLLVHCGQDLLVAKLAESAVDSGRQHGPMGRQVLDHYGFQASSPEQVDGFSAHLRKHNIEIVKGPYERSDGKSVYFRDPFGNLVEYLWFCP